ncbi:FecR family protein [Planctobacterium marinum]|uniref:Sensor n=1 Tax=Planctobacterium marinum TaxID=1631968 RepID=A0AA48HG85_9ALTE|nr:sensor [Planctobacterium marinum]
MNSLQQQDIEQQARDWLVKLESSELSAEQEDLFIAWLGESDAHGIAFQQAEQTWQLMHEAKKSVTTETQGEKVISLAKQRGRLTAKERNTKSQSGNSIARLVMSLAATVLLSFMALFWGQEAWWTLTADHFTATGQTQQRTLPDGSVITLNTHSAIKLHFSENERLVELLSGEIYVDVYSDKTRPFVVEAGAMRVTALGTEFNVKKNAGNTPTVVVTEHKVKVENTQKNAAELVLQEGQQVKLETQYNRFSNVQNVDIQQTQGWLQKKLIFENELFGNVVNELRRYTKKQIIIRNSNIEQLRVTGVVQLDDPIAALRSLTEQLNLSFNTATPYVILIDKG